MTFPFAAVLFDMDGVVVDNMPLHRQVWRDYAATGGLAPTEAEIRALDGRRASDIIVSLFPGPPGPDDIVRMAAEREDLYYSRLGTAELVAVPGVRAYLEALERLGVKRVLATSATPRNVEVVLERLGLAALFNARVTAADVTHGKPHPEVYMKAAERAGVEPSRCLVVEDALPGVKAGDASGARVLGLMTSEDEAALREAGADWVAPDFTRLPENLMV